MSSIMHPYIAQLLRINEDKTTSSSSEIFRIYKTKCLDTSDECKVRFHLRLGRRRPKAKVKSYRPTKCVNSLQEIMDNRRMISQKLLSAMVENNLCC